MSKLCVESFTISLDGFGADGGASRVDEDFAARGFQNVGAWIMGKNMS